MNKLTIDFGQFSDFEIKLAINYLDQFDDIEKAIVARAPFDILITLTVGKYTTHYSYLDYSNPNSDYNLLEAIKGAHHYILKTRPKKEPGYVDYATK